MNRGPFVALALMLGCSTGVLPAAPSPSVPPQPPAREAGLIVLPQEAQVTARLAARGVRVELISASKWESFFDEVKPARHFRTALGVLEVVFLEPATEISVCERLFGPTRLSYEIVAGTRIGTTEADRRLHFSTSPLGLALADSTDLDRIARDALGGRPGECTIWSRLGARPLQLRSIPQGTACPRSIEREVSRHFGPVVGPGPVYLGMGSSLRRFGDWGSPASDGYRYDKVLWVAAPGYRAPVLVRGARLGGSDGLRFEVGGPAELQFPINTYISAAGTTEGWRFRPSGLGVRGPGCYAFQIDGPDRTVVVVFEIAP